MERRALDAAPLPTVVLRDGRIVYLNQAAAARIGRPAGEVLGEGWQQFLPPEEVPRLADRLQRRLRGEKVPGEYEVDLVLGGRRRRIQIHAAVDDGDVVIQFVDVSSRVAQREQLMELARLGARIQRERSDEAIFAAVRDGLVALGLGAVLLRPDGDVLRMSFLGLPFPALAALEAAAGPPPAGLAFPWPVTSREAWGDGISYTDEVPVVASRVLGAGSRIPEALAALGLTRAITVRVGVAVEPHVLLAAVGPWLRQEDLPAFRLFGAQVSAALGAARAIGDLSRRNEELAALNRLAETAATAPDLPAFFARGAEELMRSLRCDGVAIWLLDEPRQELELAFEVGATSEVRSTFRRMPVAGTAVGRVLTEGVPRLIKQSEYPPHIRALTDQLGFQSHGSVPLRVRAKVVGVMNVGWREPQDARTARLELLQAMGGPFAAAVEAQRLLADLRGRVSELTLLNDVALAAARLNPVYLLETALQRVLATLESDAGNAYLVDGGELVGAAAVGFSEETLQALGPIDPSSGEAGEAALRVEPVLIPRLAEGSARARLLHEREGLETGLAVPIAVKGRALGALVVARRRPDRYRPAEVQLLSAVAAQLGVAVENARLFADTQRRVADLEAVNQLSLSVFGSGPGDAAALLQTAAGEIGRALRARSVAVLLLYQEERVLRSAAGWGAPLPVEPMTIPLGAAALATLALETQGPVWSADTSTDPRSGMRGVTAAPPMSMLLVPLTSRRAPRGVVAIAAEPGRHFGEAEVALAFALTTTAASGLENVELHGDLRRSYAELARAQAQLVQRERLVALGELSAVVAHEVRNPLGVIFNSLGSLRRLLKPEGDARMLLDIVGEEADRLNRIVGDLLDFARPSTPALRPEALDRLLEDAVGAAVAENRDIAVERDIEAGLPPVSIDARLMRQAVLNVAVNAVQAMPRGGRLTVRARRDGAWARVEIRDSGPGVPDEIRHRIFEPFFTTKASGTGLGLAVVKRIVEGHGGEVAVASDPAAGAAFTIRIPLEAGPPLQG